MGHPRFVQKVLYVPRYFPQKLQHRKVVHTTERAQKSRGLDCRSQDVWTSNSIMDDRLRDSDPGKSHISGSYSYDLTRRPIVEMSVVSHDKTLSARILRKSRGIILAPDVTGLTPNT